MTYKEELEKLNVKQLKFLIRKYTSHVKILVTGKKKHELIKHLLDHTDMTEDGQIKLKHNVWPFGKLEMAEEEEKPKKEVAKKVVKKEEPKKKTVVKKEAPKKKVITMNEYTSEPAFDKDYIEWLTKKQADAPVKRFEWQEEKNRSKTITLSNHEFLKLMAIYYKTLNKGKSTKRNYTYEAIVDNYRIEIGGYIYIEVYDTKDHNNYYFIGSVSTSTFPKEIKLILGAASLLTGLIKQDKEIINKYKDGYKINDFETNNPIVEKLQDMLKLNYAD